MITVLLNVALLWVLLSVCVAHLFGRMIRRRDAQVQRHFPVDAVGPLDDGLVTADQVIAHLPDSIRGDFGTDRVDLAVVRFASGGYIAPVTPVGRPKPTAYLEDVLAENDRARAAMRDLL